MKTLTAIFLMIVITLTAQAQSINKENIRWSVSNLTDLQSNKDTTYTCQFITYGGEKIEWIQGDYVIVMKVQNTRGKWTDIESNGSIVYDVKVTGKTGKLTFSRNSGALKIRMEFMDRSKNSTPYTFNVTEIKVIEP